MGMIGNFMQISSEQLESLKQDPDSVGDFLFPEDGGMPNCCDIDKAWQGIHFLLAGNPWQGEGAIGQVVMGGTELGEDLGFGPARYLTPEQVKQVAQAIEPIDRAELQRRFDPQSMAANDIYAFHPEDADDDLDYYLTYYDELKQYYVQAATNDRAMLLFLA